MKFDRSTGKLLQWTAIVAGAGVLGHQALPDLLPQFVPAAWLPIALLALQLAQKLIHDSAWSRNWNGSPAEEAAPPDPKELRRL